MKFIIPILFLFISSGTAMAGKHSISGLVVDRNGKPIDQAIVSLTPGNVEMITNREGEFVVEYLRDDEGNRLKLSKKLHYNLEIFKVGFHVETRRFFYKRGEAVVETIRMVEDTIQIHNDDANLSESLDTNPTHSAGANYEGQ